MDKKEILEMSRRENKNKDIVEVEVLKHGAKVATIAGMLSCCILSVVQVVFKEKVDVSLWIIFFTMMASRELVSYIKLREKSSLVMSILFVALVVFFVVMYIFQLIGA